MDNCRLFRIVDDFGNEDHVKIARTNTGLGVFTTRPYPQTAVIGEITGEVSRHNPLSTDYTFDLDDGVQLEPAAPFRYVNHSCDPNCEFDWQEDNSGHPMSRRVWLVALRDIHTGEQLTIHYNWPAEYAMRCDCRSPLCVGWIVDPTQLAAVQLSLVPSNRSTSAASTSRQA